MKNNEKLTDAKERAQRRPLPVGRWGLTTGLDDCRKIGLCRVLIHGLRQVWWGFRSKGFARLGSASSRGIASLKILLFRVVIRVPAV